MNTPNKNGITPVWIAAHNGHANAIRLLKEFGADVNAPNKNGYTPVYVAAPVSNTNVIPHYKK